MTRRTTTHNRPSHTTANTRRHLASIVAGVIMFLSVLGGCTMSDQSILDNDPLSRDTSGDRPINERGSFEDAKTRMDTMLDQITAAFKTEYPDCPFTIAPPEPDDPRPNDINGSFVTEATNDDASTESIWAWTMSSRNRVADCPFTDTAERIARAQDLVTAITTRYGFKPPIVYNHEVKPGGGYLVFDTTDPDGNYFTFRSSTAALFAYDLAEHWSKAQLDYLAAHPDAKYPPDLPPAIPGAPGYTPAPTPSDTPTPS